MELFHHFTLSKKAIVSSSYLYFIILAGTPPTMAYGGTSLVTTAWANITAPSSIVIPPTRKAPSPIHTSFPISTAILYCVKWGVNVVLQIIALLQM